MIIENGKLKMEIKKKIILASKSPRRKEILENIGLEFDIIASDIDENITEYDSFSDFVIKLAVLKGDDISEQLDNKDSVIISSDTIVVYNNREILNKPKNREDAYSMLEKLSGNVHSVYTSIYVRDNYQNIVIKDFVETKVKFIELDKELIDSYLNTGEYKDKAGGYGIQGYGSILVERIDGCYFSVMGFPISLFARRVREQLSIFN